MVTIQSYNVTTASKSFLHQAAGEKIGTCPFIDEATLAPPIKTQNRVAERDKAD